MDVRPSKWFLGGLALLVATVRSFGADAAPVTFSFTGTIAYVHPELSAAFTIGDTIAAIYTFESTALDSNASSSSVGRYNTALTAYQITTSGGYSASATGGQILVLDNSPTPDDRYRAAAFSTSTFPGFGALNGSDVSGHHLFAASVNLGDPTGTAFSSDALPTSLDLSDFDLAGFSSSYLAFDFGDEPAAYVEDGVFFGMRANVTGFSVAHPGTLALLGTSLLGLGVFRVVVRLPRRRHPRSSARTD
jgi:hypothetical protein